MKKLWWLNNLINIGITTNLREDEVNKIQLLNIVMSLILSLSIGLGCFFMIKGNLILLTYCSSVFLILTACFYCHYKKQYQQCLHLFALGSMGLLVAFSILFGAVFAVSLFIVFLTSVVFFSVKDVKQRRQYNWVFVTCLIGIYFWHYLKAPLFPQTGHSGILMGLTCSIIIIHNFLLNIFNRELDERQKNLIKQKEELKQVEAITQSALDSTTDGLMVVNEHGKIMHSNQKFSQMWHLPPEVLATKNDDAIIGFVMDQLLEPGKFITKIKELYSQPEATSFDKLFFKDGRIFERYSQPHRIENKVWGRVWSFRDITAEENAKIALKERETLFRNLYEYSPVGVVMGTHEKGQLSYANRKFCEMLGYAPLELHSKTVNDITFQEDIGIQKDKYQQLIAGKISSFELEKRYLCKNGDMLWAHVSISVARDHHGQVKYDIVIVQDISQRKRTEEVLRNNDRKINSLLQELQYKNAELEEKVNERTQTLEKSNIELKRSNQDLEQFAYIASHDLQEPLRMVGNFVQLLEKKYTDVIGEEGKVFIGFAVDGVNRMSKLIQNLLTYSRVGRKDVAFSKVNLNNIIDKKVLDLSQRIKDSQAIVDLYQLPSQIFCEPNQLGIVFYNLIGNAIKFNNSPHPQIVIKQEDKEREWLFSVADNGIGIENKYKERVFEIFKRLHRREEYEGTGIGLSLCKRIVNRHKGDIWFDSTPGNGTTFYFTISKSL